MRWNLLLYPFAILYDLVTRFRNHLYDIGSRPSFAFEANVIAVGNLSVGGTGKSPMVTYLIDHFLMSNSRIATLSRGYGRRSKGYQTALDDATPEHLGDESAMYAARYGERIQTVVCEHRALAIPQILFDDAANEVILLDDAFQHRSVIPSMSILLTTYERPFYHDHLLPTGRLREARKGARRADIVIVTKCPQSLEDSEQLSMTEHIQKYAPNASVFFTQVRYGDPVPMKDPNHSLVPGDTVIGVAGIARAKDYFKYIGRTFHLVDRKEYRDHKKYSLSDVTTIDERACANDAAILLTEKDMVKWKPFLSEIKSSVYYLPISVSFIEGEKEFISLLESSIKKYERDY